MTYKLLDLFSGIGGFSLGLERTGGFETVAFCEIEPFPRRVLAKHWPKVPCYHDIRELTAERLAADGIAVDAICGGFPCQDISNAGRGAGLDGERSGLWYEYARLIGELRPKYVLVENVSALLHRGLDAVLGSLAAIGYDADWDCIPAAYAGAPHIRDRLWLVAYPQRSNANCVGPYRAAQHDWRAQRWDEQGGHVEQVGEVLANSASDGRKRRPGRHEDIYAHSSAEHDWSQLAGSGPVGTPGLVADANRPRLEELFNGQAGQQPAPVGMCAWRTEPDVGRVAYGVPARMDRLKSLGNAVVPQIPEMIGRAILAAEMADAAA